MVEAACLALGGLYLGTGHAAVARALRGCWARHAISDVRRTCELALRAVAVGQAPGSPAPSAGGAACFDQFLVRYEEEGLVHARWLPRL